MVKSEKQVPGQVHDLVELDPQGLVELFGVRRLRGGLPLAACLLPAGGAAVLAGPSGGLKATLFAALFAGRMRESVPHRGVFPLPVTFPGDEMGIVARDSLRRAVQVHPFRRADARR
ncbi:hypothetical protein [Streptomyces puniciscabiei]|uniref:hypothetical protein n=1 Tax=Streptomyces puniciscabiei TaxID=164348 RepID=UPI003334A22A